MTHLDVAETRADLRVCRAYDLGDGTVDRLVPGPPGDLGRQGRLTERLLTALPVYEPADDGRHPGLPPAIEAMLGVPVALTSSGPTAADKHRRRALRPVPAPAPATRPRRPARTSGRSGCPAQGHPIGRVVPGG
ncbi:MAG: adenylosuccinate synthase [Streptosporangiaceae bacterium]|nr:adenylosuccinate synthase [Streptosporangiaceae bacterium]